MRAQAAIEYLMTYGWAILIIAVALAVLFSLGIFNPNQYTAKAQAGTCQVTRPYGPNTTAQVSLTGVCTGEAPREMPQLNGQDASIAIPLYEEGLQQFSICFWEYELPGPGSVGGYQVGSTSPLYINEVNNGAFEFYPNSISLWMGAGPGAAEYNTYPGGWNFLCGTYSYTQNSKEVTLYFNGAAVGTAPAGQSSLSFSQIVIGDGANTNSGGEAYQTYFPGYITNVQAYNTTLGANAVSAMYRNGLGGVPARLQNLVGWWPLNGNGNDYSGNGNDANTENGVIYTTGWTKFYSST